MDELGWIFLVVNKLQHKSNQNKLYTKHFQPKATRFSLFKF